MLMVQCKLPAMMGWILVPVHCMWTNYNSCVYMQKPHEWTTTGVAIVQNAKF